MSTRLARSIESSVERWAVEVKAMQERGAKPVAIFEPEGLLLRPVPRRQVSDLMAKSYRPEGEQLGLRFRDLGIELPDPPMMSVMNPGAEMSHEVVRRQAN